jgi:hypothetical protein
MFSIAQIRWTTDRWVKSSKDSLRLEHGAALVKNPAPAHFVVLFAAPAACNGFFRCYADEFNRIDISVLSVVSTQWKCILDAIRGRKARFIFEEEDIVLNHEPFCSAYITVSIKFFSLNLLENPNDVSN